MRDRHAFLQRVHRQYVHHRAVQLAKGSGMSQRNLSILQRQQDEGVHPRNRVDNRESFGKVSKKVMSPPDRELPLFPEQVPLLTEKAL